MAFPASSRYGLVLGAWTIAAVASAAPRSAAEQEKIDWLLTQVRESRSVFMRNGAEYDCVRAATYLSEKLFFKGRNVATARDFIEKIASRSETSGKPYEIRLPGKEARPLGPWLAGLLDAREKAPPPTPKT